MVNTQIDDEQKEQLIQILDFLKSEPGKLLVKMVSETKDNRVNDLIYSSKEDIFNYQGEVRAYNDILNLLKPETIKLIIESQ